MQVGDWAMTVCTGAAAPLLANVMFFESMRVYSGDDGSFALCELRGKKRKFVTDAGRYSGCAEKSNLYGGTSLTVPGGLPNMALRVGQ